MTNHGVRRVPTNVRSLTGDVLGHEFESSLERDALLLTHWNNDVDWYQTQPVTIEFKDINNVTRKYTPDLLVYFRKDCSGIGGVSRRPWLCEIKYRSDLAQNWKELKSKFKAARSYANQNGWQFLILTERQIRTPYLKNVQFLWSYRFAEFHPHHYRCLSETLHTLEETDARTLLEATYESSSLRDEALWTLWCMLARGWIGCDLSEPLSMSTRIWENV